MKAVDLDKALIKFENDFGFSFGKLIDNPDKYQKKIKSMEKDSSTEDTKNFCELYDDLQMELYKKV